MHKPKSHEHVPPQVPPREWDDSDADAFAALSLAVILFLGIVHYLGGI